MGEEELLSFMWLLWRARMSVSLHPDFSRARVLPSPLAVSAWSYLLPGKPPAPWGLREVTLVGMLATSSLICCWSPSLLPPKGWPWAAEMPPACHTGDEGGQSPPCQHVQMKEANSALLLISSKPRV